MTKEIDKIVEALRAAEMRQGCTDYHFYAEKLYKDLFPKPSTAREALSDEELNKAYDGAFDKPMDFDHKPTADELHTIRLRAVSQATVKGE